MLEEKLERLNCNLERLIGLIEGEVKAFPKAFEAAKEALKEDGPKEESDWKKTFHPKELQDRCLAIVKKDRSKKADIKKTIKGLTGKDNGTIGDIDPVKLALLDAALTALEAS